LSEHAGGDEEMPRDFKDPLYKGLFKNGELIFKTGERFSAGSSCACDLRTEVKNAVESPRLRAAVTDDLYLEESRAEKR